MNINRYIPLKPSFFSVQRIIPTTKSSLSTTSKFLASCSSAVTSYSTLNSMPTSQKAELNYTKSRFIPIHSSVGEMLTKGMDFKTILSSLTQIQ